MRTWLIVCILLPGCATPDYADPEAVVDNRDPMYLLGATAGDPLQVHIRWAPGADEWRLATAGVGQRLGELLGTDAFVIASRGPDPAAARATWRADDLRPLSMEFQQAQGPGRHLVILYASGEPEDPVWGHSYKQLAVTYADQVNADLLVVGPLAVGSTFREELVRATSVHEMGHSLGLVNNGIPMLTPRLPPDSEDACRCHSARPGSVMYYQNEGASMLGYLDEDERPNWAFDEHDLADLAAARAIALQGPAKH